MKKIPKINLDNYNVDFSGFKYSISFVGNPCSDSSIELLCDLVKSFGRKLHIFSSDKEFSNSVKKIKKENLLEENDLQVYLKTWTSTPSSEIDLAKIYSSSRINIHTTSKKNQKKRQLFEIFTAGGFILTEYDNDLKDYPDFLKYLDTYKTSDDLIDKIEFYLKNSEIAQKMAILGKIEILGRQQ